MRILWSRCVFEVLNETSLLIFLCQYDWGQSDMLRVLYLSNIEVPYKVRMLNELAKSCDLTVLYERRKSNNRNQAWTSSEERRYKIEYLDGVNIGNESTFSLAIFSKIFSGYDMVVVSCSNSPIQMIAILAMRICRKPYIVSTDGDSFLELQNVKTAVKRMVLKGASAYLAAGIKSAELLRRVVGNIPVEPYFFSSLSKAELEDHAQSDFRKRNRTVLVVGQYLGYKGLDVVVEAARMDMSIQYKIVGTGSRTELFLQDHQVTKLPNVEVVPFLTKHELEQEYQECAMLVLPSKQECWGLVINEAASFGMPIVSTWGSGAAVEFLAGRYECYLAKPGDAQDLLTKVRGVLAEDNTEYSRYLLEKSRQYNIEAMVNAHLKVFNC